MSETTMRFRRVYEDEMKEFEKSEWATANEGINLYFVPKLMEYEHLKKWYIPNILQWHTPNVIDGGIELSVSVREEEVYSNEDAGWVSHPSETIEFVLGEDSFIGMTTVYSRASVDRNSEKLYHLHIEPNTKTVLLDIVSNPDDEKMRQWLLKHDMHGVAYKRQINRDTFGPQVILRRFKMKSYILDFDEEINNVTNIEDPAVVAEIKRELGLK